jgi:hypothetical protein
VSKSRYRVPLGEADLIAEVDVCTGTSRRFVVAEVEFPTPEQSRDFDPPGWFGREVTGDTRYSTATLARVGLRGMHDRGLIPEITDVAIHARVTPALSLLGMVLDGAWTTSSSVFSTTCR